jgi:predicted secreted Zn-dependent protease
MSIYQADQVNLAWQVSRTCDGGQCIGVARRGDAVLIGNTSNPQAPFSEFTVSEWEQFLAGVKLGDFDGIA